MNESDTLTAFGPTGLAVYERTYSQVKPDGSKETWPETVTRVAHGNLALVHGEDMDKWPAEAVAEHGQLINHMLDFRIIPAGRHLRATGMKGRQYLFNCWVAPWGEKLSDHFEFTFMRLMEGGGVGSNYSTEYLKPYGAPRRELKVHIVCNPEHPDYQEMLDAGVLSEDYCPDWAGSFEVGDSREGWADALTDLIDTYMTDERVQHENRVYDVSNVRGRGARLKTFGGTASGPAPFARMMLEVARVMNGAVPPEDGATHSLTYDIVDGTGRVIRTYVPRAIVTGDTNGEYTFTACPARAGHLTPLEAMEIDHAIAECVVSGGNRRSARMAMLPWDDPYIFEFINCKADTGKHWTTNISVIIDDEFLKLLGWDEEDAACTDTETFDRWHLAHRVHEAVVNGMLANGEPGYFHIDNAHKGELSEIIATNPCGEIALEPREPCVLGHVNMAAFVNELGKVDFDGLKEAHRLMARFLVRATFGDVNDPQSRAVLDRNRRIGVGHLGVQDHWAKRGVRYSALPDHPFAFIELQCLRSVVRKAADEIAFELRIPAPIKVTAIAPTGSISKLPGVGGEGIHPIYARYFERRVRYSLRDPEQVRAVEEFAAQGFEVETDMYDPAGSTAVVVFPTKEKLVADVEAIGWNPAIVESADELSLEAMLGVQAMYQENYADNAISFTLNVDPDTEHEALSDALRAFLPRLKGTTVMPDNSRPQAPYTRITEAEYEAAVAKRIEDGIDEECANGACPI